MWVVLKNYHVKFFLKDFLFFTNLYFFQEKELFFFQGELGRSSREALERFEIVLIQIVLGSRKIVWLLATMPKQK